MRNARKARRPELDNFPAQAGNGPVWPLRSSKQRREGRSHRSFGIMHLRRRDERAEEPRVIALLRMPLHAHEELALCGGLDRLDDPVVGPGHRGEAGPDQVNRLVMVRRYLEELAAREDRGDDRAARDAHLVRAEPAGGAAVLLVASQVGNVLVQGAAAGDVEHLGAAADAKQGYSLPDRGLGDRQLPGVPVGCVDISLLVLDRTIDRRVDVAPAGDDNAVKDGYSCFSLGHIATGRVQNRTAPVVPDGLHVCPWQQGTLLRPATPVGVRVVRGDAYSRRHLSPSWGIKRTDPPSFPHG